MPSLSEMKVRLKEKQQARVPQTRVESDEKAEMPSCSSSFRNASGKLVIRRYFNTVRNDISVLDEALAFYEEVANDGFQHITAVGRIDVLAAEGPGLFKIYRSVYTDASQLRKWFEERAAIAEDQKHKWLLTSAEAKREYGELKVTEAGKFAKADPDVCKLKETVRLLAHAEHILNDIVEGLDKRGMALNLVGNMRIAGLEEVWVDSTMETTNE